MASRKNLSTLLFFLLFLAPCVIGQDSLWTKEQWNIAKKGIEYNNYKNEESVREIQEEKSPSTSINFNWNWLKSPLVKYIAVIAIIGLLVTTLFFTLKNKRIVNYKVQTNDIKSAIAQAEQDLENASFDDLLQRCVNEKDYRTAVRLLYLITIQNLHQAGKIRWKKEKTNRHFLNEMKNDSSFDLFKKLTAAYEIIWYGDHVPDETIFSKIYTSYTSFNSSISK